MKCSEYGSTYHDAAMHPGPSPQVVKAPSPSQEDGGEGEDHSNMAVVNTSCTEVCGPRSVGPLMLKNLPRKAVPKGSKDMAIKPTLFWTTRAIVH